MIETYRGAARQNEMDHMGHMNVQFYVSKFDDATWHLFSSIGLTNTYFRENKRGMAAVQQNITYKAEVLAGDLLHCSTDILEIKEKTLRFMHYLYNSETGKLSATAEMTGAHLDREARKACPFPENIRKAAEATLGVK